MKDGGPAFPASGISGGYGMSLRDYFAAAVVVEAYRWRFITGDGADPSSVAKEAYLVADAMLAEREK